MFVKKNHSFSRGHTGFRHRVLTAFALYKKLSLIHILDKYLMGTEVEVDAICDGNDYLIPGIMQHIERAGIHSGDSISVYPAQTLSQKVRATIIDYTGRLALSLIHI